MLKTLATGTLIFAAATAAHGQTFSKTTIDTSGLEYFAMPGHGGCLDKNFINTHACEPTAALLKAIVPAPPADHAVISTRDVLQLCAMHNKPDVVCGMAALLEFKYHNPPCWDTNKC